jgi:lysophospholipase L1-like esterase
MEDDRGDSMLEPTVRRLEEGGVVVVAGLGDSLTYGWMVRRGFFDRFVDDLEQRFAGARIDRVNAGVPGDTARGGLRRIAPVLGRSPDLMVVQFALNDAYSLIDPDSFEETIELIARAAIDAGVVPVLATSCPLVVEAEQRMADRFYDRIRGVARALEVPLADLERSWLAVTGPVAQRDDLFLADGVHPTDEGHQLMADGLSALFTSSMTGVAR